MVSVFQLVQIGKNNKWFSTLVPVISGSLMQIHLAQKRALSAKNMVHSIQTPQPHSITLASFLQLYSVIKLLR